MFCFRAFSQVLVRNLDSSLTRAQVMSCFSQVGKIKDLLLEYDEDTLSNSGFALLEYEFTESGRKARETFTGRRIGDQFIEVEILEADPVNSQLESVKFEKREEYKTREKVNLFQTQI